MRRSIGILLAVVLASAAIVTLASVLVRRICAQHLVHPSDDLAWFRRQFQLSEAELQRISQLHEGYLPKCREMCDRIAAKKRELQTALVMGKGLTPDTEQKLIEVGLLRSQCQAQMLRHFYEVSQAMPAEKGRRYLAEMQRLTLGYHEQFEQKMSGSPASQHGQH